MKKHVAEEGFGVYERVKGWNNKNLAFLVEFMMKQGITTQDLADAMNYSRSAITRWLRRDDMRLSRVHEIANAFGYEFVISYTVPNPASHRINLIIDRYISKEDSNLENCRLAFLRFAMAQAKVSMSTIADAVEIHRNGITRWCIADDVNMHYVFTIAEKMGWKVNIQFNKKKDSEENAQSSKVEE